MSLPLKFGKMRGTLVYLKRTKEFLSVRMCVFMFWGLCGSSLVG